MREMFLNLKSVYLFLQKLYKIYYPDLIKIYLEGYFQIEINEEDQTKAENKVDEMCKKLLVNLIIEDYKIDKI